jgi:hypothetical protein
VEKKSMWRREMDCLLSVCDYIVEFFPSKDILPDGTTREVRNQHHGLKMHSFPHVTDDKAFWFCQVMATRPRSDIYVNLPALEKLDDMLLVRSELISSFAPSKNLLFTWA